MNITKKLQENITTWCEALRSGEYKQGDEGHLQDGKGGYCCLPTDFYVEELRMEKLPMVTKRRTIEEMVERIDRYCKWEPEENPPCESCARNGQPNCGNAHCPTNQNN